MTHPFLQSLRLKHLTPEEDEYLLNLAADSIFTRVLIWLSERLTSPELDTVYRLISQNDEAGLTKYLEEKGIDLEALLKVEVTEYQEEISTMQAAYFTP